MAWLTALALFAATLVSATFADAQSPTLRVTEGSGRIVSLPSEAAAIFVGDPGVASVQAVSSTSFLLGGIVPGRTNVLALDFEDRQIAAYSVIVAPDNETAARTLLDGGGDIGIRQDGNAAIIVGTANTLDQALSVLDAQRGLLGAGRQSVNRTRQAGGVQVSLRVRFVEASRSELISLGFDFSAIDGGSLRLLTGSGIAADFVNGTGGIGNDALRIGGGGVSGDVSIDAVLSALERKGIVRILSEPTLTTTSGTRANFRAGGEFAFPVPQGDGVIAAEFKQFGVSVDFLPTVLPNGRIALEVAPEVSFIDADVGVVVEGFSVPSLSVRRAETTVEVGSGQTFAIAGLYEQFATESDRGLPGTRRSFMRGLFGTSTQRRDERELVIFITPFLAEASDAAAPNRNQGTPLIDTIGFIYK